MSRGHQTSQDGREDDPLEDEGTDAEIVEEFTHKRW
jgi:hypothetical protein